MWQRDTYHVCAAELEQASERFREAFLGMRPLGPDERSQELVRSSKDGVDILKILALSVRPEQDFGSLPHASKQVGKLLCNVGSAETQAALTAGQLPPIVLPGATPLELREALNKIAHMDPRPSKSSFAVDEQRHEVVLTGEKHGSPWIAVLDIPALCDAIKALPDRDIVPPAK
jgi:hypothetical protein